MQSRSSVQNVIKNTSNTTAAVKRPARNRRAAPLRAFSYTYNSDPVIKYLNAKAAADDRQVGRSFPLDGFPVEWLSIKSTKSKRRHSLGKCFRSTDLLCASIRSSLRPSERISWKSRRSRGFKALLLVY